MSVRLLDDWQDDIRDRLLNDEYLKDVTVLSQDDKSVLEDISQMLGTLTPRNGKIGLSIIALQPDAKDANSNTLFGPLDMEIRVVVLEDVTINRGTGGTGIPGFAAAIQVYRVLKLYQAIGIATPLVPENPCIVFSTEYAPLRGYEVRFQARSADPHGLTKVSPAIISPAGGLVPQTVTLTCATAGAMIHYTTSGAHPRPGQAGTTQYTVPFNQAAAATIKAICKKTQMIESDMNAAVFT